MGIYGIMLTQNAKAISKAIYESDYKYALSLIENAATDYNEDFYVLVLKYNIATLQRKTGQISRAVQTVKEIKALNDMAGNRFPYLMAFINAQEGYLYMENRDYDKALTKFITYVEHSYTDRYENFISVLINIKKLLKKLERPFPEKLLPYRNAVNPISTILAENHLIFCELLFWE